MHLSFNLEKRASDRKIFYIGHMIYKPHAFTLKFLEFITLSRKFTKIQNKWSRKVDFMQKEKVVWTPITPKSEFISGTVSGYRKD